MNFGIRWLLVGAVWVCACVDGAQTNAPGQFMVSLQDGSCIKGEVLLVELPVTASSLGELKVPVLRIAGFQQRPEQPAVVLLQNGDRVQGVIRLEALPLQTVLGKLIIPLQLVTEVKSVQLGASAKRIPVPLEVATRQQLARQIINDARQLDAAADQWALETGQVDGARIVLRGIADYLVNADHIKALQKGEAPEDALGTNQVTVHSDSKEALRGIGVDWGPY